jgi:hypothetical protein
MGLRNKEVLRQRKRNKTCKFQDWLNLQSCPYLEFVFTYDNFNWGLFEKPDKKITIIKIFDKYLQFFLGYVRRYIQNKNEVLKPNTTL